MRVAAIGEAALAEILSEFNKALFYPAQAQVVQAECLYTGAVDEVAVGVQVIQSRMGGGVFAGIECGGNLACGGLRIGDDGIDKGGFPHAGLSDQYASVALQVRQQCCHILFGGQLQYWVADSTIGGELRTRGCTTLRQITFVQYDEDVQILVVCSDQAARDQLVVERRFGGNNNDELCDIGGNDFLPVGIGTIEQGDARCNAFNDALIGSNAIDFDHITAGDFTLLSARYTFQNFAVGQFCQIMPSKRRYDLSLQLQTLCSASTFAAQIKSFSDKPLMAWVV